jgi:hypothetical protein
MNTRRIAASSFVGVVGVTAFLLLVTALASAQRVSVVDPPSVQEPSDLGSPASLSAVQATSVTFRGEWPRYAHGEIFVNPDPPFADRPTELCAIVVNEDASNAHAVELEFSVAGFGVGGPFSAVGRKAVDVPAGGTAEGCIIWVPPEPGHWCIQAAILSEGNEPVVRQRNLDIWEPLHPGEPHDLQFPIGPLPKEGLVTFTVVNHLPGWDVALIPPEILILQPDEPHTVTLRTIPPRDAMLGTRLPIVDVEAFLDGASIGGFRKLDWQPVPLHRSWEPSYAESEITVEPYPTRAGEPTELCVELTNISGDPHDVEVLFSWAEFGIGMPFWPIDGPRLVHLPPHSVVRECIHWIPPQGGQVCLQAELFMAGYHPQRSQRNIDVDEPLEPNIAHPRVFPVRNPGDGHVTITMGLIPHLRDWGLEISPDVLTRMLPGEVRPVTLTVTPLTDLPPDGTPIVDVQAFVEGELIGGFRKLFRPAVPIHRPGDPIYAESEIFVHPYPPRAREPTELGVEIRNPTDEPRTVTVTFSYADFGIGLPFTPINRPLIVDVPEHGMVRPIIMWVPPEGGLWCIQVELELPGHQEPFYSQRNIDVGEPLEPNVPHSRPFLVGNPGEESVTITLGLIPHFPDWGLELSQDALTSVLPGQRREVILTVTPPDDLPPDGAPIVDVEAYLGDELLGGFRKVFRPPVPIHRPRDPVYAESEIGVDPYPAIPGQPTQLSVEVFNPTEKDQVVTATFSVAAFGIGLPFSPADITPNPIQIFVPAHGAARGHVIWRPPAWSGKFCVRVTLQMKGHEPIWSQRNIDVGEPLEPGAPHSLAFQVGGWPHDVPVTVTLGLIKHRDGWQASLSDRMLANVGPGQPVTATLTVTPPRDARLGSGEPIADVEAFVDGELIGGFRKLDVPPVPIHKPHEKGYAESEISIEPYPPQQGQHTRVSTAVQNTSENTVTVQLEFGWAKFGMGIPFTTTGMTPYVRTVTLSAGMTETASVNWTPTYPGPQCVRIRLTDPQERYEPQESQRNVDVSEHPPCDETKVFTFTVRSDSPFTTTVDIGLITFNVPPTWEVTVVPSDTLVLGPFSEGVVTVKVRIPCPPTLQAIRHLQRIYVLQDKADGVPTVDVEGYIEGALVGGIEIRFPHDRTVVYLPLILKTP